MYVADKVITTTKRKEKERRKFIMSATAIAIVLLEIVLAVFVIWCMMNEKMFIEFENKIIDAIIEWVGSVRTAIKNR